MTTYSNILAWKIPWTEEPGGLQSMEMAVLDRTEHEHLCLRFFASGICPLVGVASLEACEGFLVRRDGACPLVGGSGSWSSGGQGHV